ncbi:MAG: hypothetical protein QM530_05255 [Phycisphaerales bacterium]|nr:hypothetical protein [Phycisphaerales bacterium]
MDFTQEQISLIFDEIANQKNGYQSILKLSLEAIMRTEPKQFNLINPFGGGGDLQPGQPTDNYSTMPPIAIPIWTSEQFTVS